ncbi:6-bladed beta-propeller [Candidatus Aminicenantes bacterium AC-708-M15]|jgi:hypothetical protein|nr:6-bladed beta-propeller [SCandidatus Aminicenantes bacterium Aminicenantia_JdfR_composite]MCP2604157.1 6-bladed beta-propeller [Candidatus Aminicenantes bacterium AC-708-M15]MCP2617936.1 6-bladed beta-propeller [Candidatus Aminicenantes bacterium AC-335-A11]
MKGAGLLRTILIGILIINSSSLIMCQKQKTYDEEYQKKMRMKWLKEVPLPPNSIELKFKYSFPSKDLEKKGIYLFGANFISNDFSGNIFVTDTRAHQIFKFAPSGRFLAKIGKKGQGPGEFSRPSLIMHTEDYIIVYDRGNYRIQFFDRNGNYVKSFKLYKTYFDMVINKNGLIFAAPILRTKKSFLIDVLTQDGKLLYSFGKPKDFKYGWIQLNFIKLATNVKGEIFAAFIHFPIIRKYSPEGKFLAEFRVRHKAVDLAEKMNQTRISKQMRTGFIAIIDGIKSLGNKIYISHSAPRWKIFEFDSYGKQKRLYWHLPSWDVHYTDFLIQKKGNKKVFYFLQSTPENKICVFIPKIIKKPKGGKP